MNDRSNSTNCAFASVHYCELSVPPESDHTIRSLGQTHLCASMCARVRVFMCVEFRHKRLTCGDKILFHTMA